MTERSISNCLVNPNFTKPSNLNRENVFWATLSSLYLKNILVDEIVASYITLLVIITSYWYYYQLILLVIITSTTTATTATPPSFRSPGTST